ncbi:hypothetical protein M422DRAFT_44644 [Sphaerobolus stellatus SS14]|nr:hypothetical protein M422DRAFT_44644 [Sphaerobolus stellatus SS14]
MRSSFALPLFAIILAIFAGIVSSKVVPMVPRQTAAVTSTEDNISRDRSTSTGSLVITSTEDNTSRDRSTSTGSLATITTTSSAFVSSGSVVSTTRGADDTTISVSDDNSSRTSDDSTTRGGDSGRGGDDDSSSRGSDDTMTISLPSTTGTGNAAAVSQIQKTSGAVNTISSSGFMFVVVVAVGLCAVGL